MQELNSYVDALAPARGILVGILAAAVIWALIAWAWWNG